MSDPAVVLETRQLIVFTVPGIPAPGGSKRGFVVKGRVVITEDAKHAQPWRAVVQLAAREAMGARPPLEGVLTLVVTFSLPRPKGHRGVRGLRRSASVWPTVRPDVTKLLRAIEDACSGIVWRDDAQIVQQRAVKQYGENPGVVISVGQVEVMA